MPVAIELLKRYLVKLSSMKLEYLKLYVFNLGWCTGWLEPIFNHQGPFQGGNGSWGTRTCKKNDDLIETIFLEKKEYYKNQVLHYSNYYLFPFITYYMFWSYISLIKKPNYMETLQYNNTSMISIQLRIKQVVVFHLWN